VTKGSQMLILCLAGADRSANSGILSLGHDDDALSDVVISVVVLGTFGT
jgi:hypothetical protein